MTTNDDSQGQHELDRDLRAYARALGQRVRAEQPDRDDSDLVQRILASTTREDLGWRGDLRLVGGFLRERLAQSTLLRLAAASLMVHLVAVPVALAWVLLRPGQPEVRLGFEPAPHPVPFEEDLPEELEQVLPPGLDELDHASPTNASTANASPTNARAWDAALLRAAHEAGRVPKTQGPSPEGDLALALHQRAQVLAGELAAEQVHLPAAGPARTVALEALLDAWVLEGGLDPRLPEALSGALAESRSEPFLPAAVLQRAARYGLGVIAVQPSPAESAPLDPSAFDAWLDALATQLGPGQSLGPWR